MLISGKARRSWNSKSMDTPYSFLFCVILTIVKRFELFLYPEAK